MNDLTMAHKSCHFSHLDMAQNWSWLSKNPISKLDPYPNVHWERCPDHFSSSLAFRKSLLSFLFSWFSSAIVASWTASWRKDEKGVDAKWKGWAQAPHVAICTVEILGAFQSMGVLPCIIQVNQHDHDLVLKPFWWLGDPPWQETPSQHHLYLLYIFYIIYIIYIYYTYYIYIYYIVYSRYNIILYIYILLSSIYLLYYIIYIYILYRI